MATGHQDDALARGEPAGSVPRHRASRQGELLDLPEPGERPVTMAGVVDPVARILLDSPVPHLDRTFDYVVPAAMAQEALPGTRVVVRFGEQEMRGWVWERAATTTHIGRLSPLRRVVSDLPVLPETSRRLIEAVASRSAGTRSDVVRLALPTRHATTENAERDKAPRDLPSWERPSNECGWQHYVGGEELLTRLADGDAPRVAWCALPARDEDGLSEPGSSSDSVGRSSLTTEPWQVCLARAVQACLAGARGAVIVVATTEQAEDLASRLRVELGDEPVVVLSAEHGPARRYRAFVSLLLGRARVVVGTRAAAFAPVRRLGLAAIWDDGDNRLVEPHAPYAHARTVLALRSSLEGAGLLIGGYSRSVETQSLVEQGWCQDLSAPRHVVRGVVPRTEVPGPAELDREGASGAARAPVIGAPGAAARPAGGTCACPGAASRLCATGGLCPLSVRRSLSCVRRTGGDGSPGSHGLSLVCSDGGAVDLSRVRRSCPEDGDGRFHAHGGGARAGFSRYPCGGLGSTGGPRCRGRGRQLTASCRGHTRG